MTDFKLLNRFDYRTHQVYGKYYDYEIYKCMNEYKNTFTIQIINVYQSIVDLNLLKKQHNYYLGIHLLMYLYILK